MKKYLPIVFALFMFYCLPQGKGYFCIPIDFEIREFAKPSEKWGTVIQVSEQHRCDRKGEKIVCVPFEKGAILLDKPVACPEPSNHHWNTTYPLMTPTAEPKLMPAPGWTLD